MTDAYEAGLLRTWQSTRSPSTARELASLPVDPKWVQRLKEIARARHDRARPRIKALPDDPRVTEFFIECMQRSRWPFANAGGLWSLILDRLVALRDVRAIEPLRSAIATPPHFSSAKHTASMVARFRTALSALEVVCGGVSRSPIIEPRSRRDAASCLAAVWKRPDDDAARRVLADALLEVGDPHGEFISLQLNAVGSRTVTNQMKKLVREHGAQFAGPIARVTTRKHWTFEKGFLSSCQLVPTDRMIPRRSWEDAVNAPHWATVKIAWFGGYGMPKWWLPRWLAEAPILSLQELHYQTAILRRAGPGSRWSVARSPAALRLIADRLATELRSL